MNSYDPNGAYIYNQYLIQSNGIHPSPTQYHIFAQNFYYYQNHQMQYYQPVQMQYYQMSQNQENFIIDVKQQEHRLQPTNNTKKNCDLNMECKDISCLLFHHPSLNKK
jgi:hypothetical protein